MPTLSTDNRRLLEKTIVLARELAERAARAALEALAVGRAKPDGHMSDEQKALRNHLRARARQLGDKRAANDTHEIAHLVRECAYEHWHRMLFARFLAENNLLIEPDTGVAISLDECKELAKEEKTDLWTLAGRYAQRMLPQIFRADDPVLQVRLAREDELKLEGLVDRLPVAVFTATDSLGWCYQFWQTDEKKRVNESENKIGADELPAVTQLFTEDYMVDFLLDNTLGAWWAGRQLAANSRLLAGAKTEEECRRKIALPGCEWKYLRFVKDEKAGWRPAAGTFDGWPKTVKELKCMDPCCGSGHFLVAMFERLVALRMAEEGANKRKAAEAVVRDNIFGLEIDPRCTQIAAFNLALAVWKFNGQATLPPVNIACSGLGVGGTREDWVALAPEYGYEMEQLHRLFRDAPTLGSLISPRRQASLELGGTPFEAIRTAIVAGLERFRKELDFEREELGVSAQGLTGAFNLLSGNYTLIATNVPYLGIRKQDEALKHFVMERYAESKEDLATVFCARFSEWLGRATMAVVTPQNWMYQYRYRKHRRRVLESETVHLIARIGEGGFQSPQAAGAFAALYVISCCKPSKGASISSIDASDARAPQEKREILLRGGVQGVAQESQLKNPDARLSLETPSAHRLLNDFVITAQGIKTGDDPLWVRCFWEFSPVQDRWRFYQSGATSTFMFSARHYVIDWDTGGEGMVRPRCDSPVVGKRGVVASTMRSISVTLYSGELHSSAATPLVPRDEKHLPAVWAFCSSPEYNKSVREIEQNISVTTDTLAKVPFDLEKWDRLAKEKYPRGLPLAQSSDPTQWLFDGQPAGSEQPLHVAVARMIGYRWPRQTGTSFADCPALKADGLEKLADDDGIACIPSVRGEQGAADRLLRLLTAAGIRPDRDMDEWLRSAFFEEHCALFHDRPFVWHIWDGRKRDGFHALVNYHKLADGVKGRRLLEKLTHAYLGDWITRQRAEVKDGKEGADARLAAALALKERLEAIIAGEPPYDIFVRWKPLAKQAIGWEPDLNDGVRMNIRAFMASDLPGGKKGAGVLRTAPKIKWTKDRGKEPHRAKDEYPWFWGWDEKTKDFMGGKAFDGNRWNDCHYSNDMKREAREST